MTFSKQFGWPIIEDIEIGLVHNWLKAILKKPRQVAESTMERTLFAFLNALYGDADITHILWLSHALEAFYKTPKEYVSRTLRNRLFNWLSAPEVDTLRRNTVIFTVCEAALSMGRSR